jgi:hypothetical protein
MADNILHDARYEYLGRIDYLKLTDKLFREKAEHGKLFDKKSWRDEQKKTLLNHDFLTKTAQLLRSVTIKEQIAMLQEK